MTNFQSRSNQRLTRERVLLWSPVILGAVLSAVAAGSLVWPSLQHLHQQQMQLADLKEQQARLPLLRQQLVKLEENLEKVHDRERRILQLIAGSGDISTFIAQLGQEAQHSGVQMDSYEPVITLAAPADSSPAKPKPKPKSKSKSESNEPPPPPPDPLLAPGLQKTSLLITARGNGPQLLDFLRRLERLSLLVVQSDLTFKYEPAPGGSKSGTAPSAITTLKLTLSLYSKAPASSSAANKVEPPAAPGSAPAKL